MKLYHGGTDPIEMPKLLKISRKLDFGAGFYTTSDFEQAKRWAQIKQNRNSSSQAVVSIYDFEENSLLNKKNFEVPNEEWLDFILAHRRGEDVPCNFDIVSGPVANDSLYETLSLFERGILTYEETIARLKVQNLTDQITFKTDLSLKFLRFIEEVTV